MKQKTLTIGTQLYLSLGAILVLVMILGGVAWRQSSRLWQNTRDLYEHPLTVRRAIGELKADVLSISRDMKDLCLDGSDQKMQTILQSIDTTEADAYREFEIIFDRYLGPRSDIDEAYQAFVQWKAIRDETIRLLQEGKTSEAILRTQTGGIGDDQVEKILREVENISDFARNRGDQFYQEAGQLNNDLSVQLKILIGIIILLTAGVGYFLLKGVRDPLRELTAVTGQYRQGQFDARSQYVSSNEFGALAAAFNQMAEVVQTHIQVKESAASLAGVMLREEELRSFCQTLLQALLEQTGSQIGAVYLLNEQKAAFENIESIGLGSSARATFSAIDREGEFGTALATQKIQHITKIPADSRFIFSTIGGDFLPREIITIPVLSNHQVVAMVSLASIHSYPEPALRLVNETWSVLTARLNNLLAFRQIREFSEKLEQQNRELEAQKQELAVQTGEINQQNTELEMQNRQLDEANRLKSTFLSNMSHELRTPLNSVIALSGVLNRRLAGKIPEDEHSYIEVIERNGKHLLSLINDILDLARIESGREELSFTRFPVRVLVGEVVAMIEPQAHEKQIVLLNEVDDELPLITTDLDKCRHILQNLVGNAVKFTETGSVKISARQSGTTLRVVVSDTGIGISADQLPHIFDEFRQADGGTSRKYGGTGLGLAIALKYARLLQGDITVQSTPGQGSSFTLQLPLLLNLPKTTNETEEYAGLAEKPEAFSGHGHSLLLVEDAEPIIIQMTDMLTSQGYQVRVARNGKQALELIEQNLPEAVILDLMMPEVDGFQVLKAIRSTEKTASLPVLILTARQVTREELSFLKGNHIHQLIQKGDISRAALLAAVAKMVAPPQKQPAPLAPPPDRTPPTGRPVILVVEDNVDNLRTIRALLDETCTVLEATDGKTGVEMARQHMPDLILMDLALPVMDGYTALAAIRADEALRYIPVVVVTASAMKGNREEILAHGFDGYISKPIDEKILQKTLREVLYGN